LSGFTLIKIDVPLSFKAKCFKVYKAPMFKVTPNLMASEISSSEIKFSVYKIYPGLYPHSRALLISPGETTSTYLIPSPLFLIILRMSGLLFAFIAYDI